MQAILIIIACVLIFYLSGKNKKLNIQKGEYDTQHQPEVPNQNKDVTIDKLNYSKQVFNEFVVLDIETTGFNPCTDKIVEIAALKYKDGALIGEYYTLINPQVHIPMKVVRIHGINDKMVRNSPTIKEKLPELLSFIGELPIVAHNAELDINFLNANIHYLNKSINNPIIDTLKISREIYSELPNLKEYLEMDSGNHKALNDTKVATEIYLRYCKLNS